ncbi:MAG: hypothetical protein ACFB0A_04815 [Croceivirga sp.]
MRRWWFLAILLFFTSCQYFLSKEEQTQKRVNDELMAIDWNDVDKYPLFEACDEMASKPVQRNCFEQEMLKRFMEAFSDTVYEVDREIKDTLFVDFEVDEDGFVNITEIEENNVIEQVVPGFRDEIRKRFRDLTVIPAHKRGINVKIKFRLPIVLDTGG